MWALMAKARRGRVGRHLGRQFIERAIAECQLFLKAADTLNPIVRAVRSTARARNAPSNGDERLIEGSGRDQALTGDKLFATDCECATMQA